MYHSEIAISIIIKITCVYTDVADWQGHRLYKGLKIDGKIQD